MNSTRTIVYRKKERNLLLISFGIPISTFLRPPIVAEVGVCRLEIENSAEEKLRDRFAAAWFAVVPSGFIRVEFAPCAGVP